MSFERHVHFNYVRLVLQLIEPGHLKTQKYTYILSYIYAGKRAMMNLERHGS